MLRVGPRIGVDAGGMVGIRSSAAAAASWGTDATSGKGMPASSEEWDAVRVAAGAGSGSPFLLWGMQETSGNILDQIGSFDGVVTGAARDQAVPGWSTRGVTTTQGAIHHITNSDAGLPNVASDDIFVLYQLYMGAITGAVIRTICQVGTTFDNDLTARTAAGTPHYPVVRAGANTATGTVDPASRFDLFGLLIDRTNSRAGLFTLGEKLTVAVGGTGKRIRCGGDNSSTWTAGQTTFMQVTAWSGAAARLTDANIKAIYETLGHTVAWSP